MSFKVLIVEDNTDSRNLLHYFFTTKGAAAVTACDGKEGLYLAKTEKPDLIIADFMMPDMDGAELVRLIRAEAETATAPIVIYTAYSATEAQPAIDAGAFKVFFKPIDLEAMIDFVMDFAKRAGNE